MVRSLLEGLGPQQARVGLNGWWFRLRVYMGVLHLGSHKAPKVYVHNRQQLWQTRHPRATMSGGLRAWGLVSNYPVWG